MTSRDPKRSRSWPRYIWSQISWKHLEIGTWFQWSTNRKPHMGNRIVTWSLTSRDLERSRSWPRYIWSQISRKRLEIGTWFHRAPIGNPIWGIESSRDRWRHVTLKGQGRDPNMFRAQYLENGWGYRFSYVGASIRYLIPICLSSGHMLDDVTWPCKY